MKTEIVVSALASLSLVAGRPFGSSLVKREVPQEHSHEQFLTTVRASLASNNPDQISDPVFGLLGNAAAAGGAGKIADTECLQQATADQAFTNAKAANDVTGMTAALIYRALERNTGQVGLKSNSCTSIQATNPEIAALSQHQDPASDGAAATNKAITLALAQQIASVGGNATEAILSGTFAPGNIGDSTGKGNTCDDQNDPVGCAISQNLIVPDATVDEINAAVSGGAGAAGASGAGAAGSNSTVTAGAGSPPLAGTNSSSSSAASNSSAASSNSTSSTSTTVSNSTGATAGFGDASCSDPAIAFAVGFDGRKEASFEPDDTATFKHGSALNPGIVAQFICDRLNDQCKAPASTVATCRSAQTAINGKNGDPAAADTFNSALGVTASKQGVDAAAGTAGAGAGNAGGDAAGAGSAGSNSGSSTSTSTSSNSSGFNTGSSNAASSSSSSSSTTTTTTTGSSGSGSGSGVNEQSPDFQAGFAAGQAAAAQACAGSAGAGSAAPPAAGSNSGSGSSGSNDGSSSSTSTSSTSSGSSSSGSSSSSAQSSAAASSSQTTSNSGSNSGSNSSGMGSSNSGKGKGNGNGKGKGNGKGGKGNGSGSGSLAGTNSTSTSISCSNSNSSNSTSSASNSTSASSSSNSTSSDPASSSSSNSTYTSAGTGSTAGSASLGSCTNPTIAFAPASDRGGANAFQPVNTADFNHGSALNINVVASFICQQLQDKCKASTDAVSACQNGVKASSGLQGQAAADAFNAAVGA